LAYWKQRGKITWVTLGEKNSRFFIQWPPIRKGKNHIASLTQSDGSIVSEHAAKSAPLLDSYKERLGHSETLSDLPRISELRSNQTNLTFLEEPFTHQEIDDIVDPFIVINHLDLMVSMQSS
jgi:hypothetical protein